jgi:hypothetical protein
MFWVIAGLAIVVAILVLRDAWQQGLWRGSNDCSEKERERKNDELEKRVY